MSITVTESSFHPLRPTSFTNAFATIKTLHWAPGQGSNWGLLLIALGLAFYLWFFSQRAFYLAAFATIAPVRRLGVDNRW